MKKCFSSFLVIFLSLVILFGAQGFTIGKMLCLTSGKVDLSFSEPVDCCAKKESSNKVIKNKCCDLKSTTYKLSNFHQHFFSKLDLLNALPVSTNFSLDLFFTDQRAEHTIPVSKAPPLSGRDILIFTSVFII